MAGKITGVDVGLLTVSSWFSKSVNIIWTKIREGYAVAKGLDTHLSQRKQKALSNNNHEDCVLVSLCVWESNFFFFTLFYFTILYWFCHTSTWIRHGCTWVPNPESPSHLPKKYGTRHEFVSSLHRGRANFLCIIPILVYVLCWTYLFFTVLILLRCSLGGKADFSDASGSEPYLSTY